MKYLKELPIEKRKKARANIEKLRDNTKKQNELLSELVLLPNEILLKTITKVLNGREPIELLSDIGEKTRERYKDVFKTIKMLEEKDDA